VHAVAARRGHRCPGALRVPALAAADLRLHARQLRAPGLQHAGAADVRCAAGACLGRAAVPHLLPDLRGRRGGVPARRGLVDHVEWRAGVSDGRCVGWRVRPAAGLRTAVPAPAGDAADPPGADEGTDLGDRLRADRTAAGLQWLATMGGALRAPGRYAVRLAADPLRARPAALRRPQGRAEGPHRAVTPEAGPRAAATPAAGRPASAASGPMPCTRTPRRRPPGSSAARWCATSRGRAARSPRAGSPRRWTAAAATGRPTR